jgi:ABC-type Fe3+-siderophore transport system permease subunit
MNGEFVQKTISKAFPIERNQTIREILILAFLGVFAVVLRAKLRIPLSMPGHHGLEVMAIFLIGRSFSRISLASTILAVAAAFTILIPFFGFKDPFLPIIYILMGVAIDFLYKNIKGFNSNIVLFAILGGISYMIIPLSRIVIHLLTGFPYNSFIKAGYFLPVLSHFVFGLAGALLAASLINFTKRLRKQMFN